MSEYDRAKAIYKQQGENALFAAVRDGLSPDEAARAAEDVDRENRFLVRLYKWGWTPGRNRSMWC